MEKTVFVVYEGSVEIKEGKNFNVDCILNDNDPRELKVFDDRKAAVDYAAEKMPVMSVSDGMGMAVKYTLVRGVWVEEQDRTYGDDGELEVIDGIGTWFISSLPRYRVLDEFVDKWLEGSQIPDDFNENGLIIDRYEILRLASEWSISYHELMKQVEKI